MRDFFFLAFNNLRRRKLRSWLTILGIFIGIAAVVSLISLGQGLQEYISKQFQQMGSNTIMILPGGGEYFGAFAGKQLKKEDLEAVKKIDGVDIASEMFYKTGKVKFKDEIKNTLIIGLPVDGTAKIIEDTQGFEVEKGRNLKEGDSYKVVVGWLLWNKEFFKKSVNLRDKLEVEGEEFEVVGLTSRIGNRADDSRIYIPIDKAREIFGEKEEISTIFVQVKEGYNLNNLVEKIKKELREVRNEKRGEESFQVRTFEQLLKTFTNVFSIVQAVLIGIAAISLLVGGIGIANTMYTSVLERTKEIGTMKAIGAKNSDIFLIFLVESGLLGLVGGAIGIIIGIGLGKGAEYIASAALGTKLLRASFPFWLILGALLFGFTIGSLSGLLPAMQASKLKPADALRYE